MEIAQRQTDAVVPAILCGRHRDARREWRKVVRKALKEGTWSDSLDALEWVHIDEAPEPIMMWPPVEDSDYRVQMFVAFHEVREQEIRIDGFDHAIVERLAHEARLDFWYSLALIASGGVPSRNVQLHYDSLRCLLYWWREIERVEERFCWVGPGWENGPRWEHWRVTPISLCIDLGAPKSFRDEMKEATSPADGRRLVEACAAKYKPAGSK